MKYLKQIRDHFNDPGYPVVRLQDIRTFTSQMGMSGGYLKRTINYLMEKGELKRITKGAYTFHDDIAVVGFAFQPFYYGMENALTIRNLWGQSTNPIVMTTRTVRFGARELGGGNYIVRRVRREHFFGYDMVRYHNFWVPVSNMEKTIIDMVYFQHGVDMDVLVGLRKKVNTTRLAKYLERYDAAISEATLRMLGIRTRVKVATGVPYK